MRVDIDLESVLKRAQELETELEVGASIPDAVRAYYHEKDGKLVLDAKQRDEFVEYLTGTIDRENLAAENRRLTDERDRRLVADEVRHHLARVGVKPELMAGAAAHFISQHKFAVRDGKVVVIDKTGAFDAEIASITWASRADTEAYIQSISRPSSGGFADAISKLKTMN